MDQDLTGFGNLSGLTDSAIDYYRQSIQKGKYLAYIAYHKFTAVARVASKNIMTSHELNMERGMFYGKLEKCAIIA